MADIHYKIISPDSGAENDGSIIGRVDQSTLVGALSNALLATNVYAFFMNSDTGSISNLGTAITAGSAQPFGAVGQMSAGDGFILACDDDVKDIYVRIDTAGVGSWTGLTVKDSSNGRTFDRTLTGHTDTSNGFKNTGWHQITVPHTVTHSSFSPAPTVSNGIETERRYVMLQLGSFVSASVAPVIGAIFLRHHDSAVTYRDFTTTANAAAITGGAAVSSLYRTGADPDVICVVH